MWYVLLFSCTRQLYKWPCHWLTDWLREAQMKREPCFGVLLKQWPPPHTTTYNAAAKISKCVLWCRTFWNVVFGGLGMVGLVGNIYQGWNCGRDARRAGLWTGSGGKGYRPEQEGAACLSKPSPTSQVQNVKTDLFYLIILFVVGNREWTGSQCIAMEFKLKRKVLSELLL